VKLAALRWEVTHRRASVETARNVRTANAGESHRAPEFRSQLVRSPRAPTRVALHAPSSRVRLFRPDPRGGVCRSCVAGCSQSMKSRYRRNLLDSVGAGFIVGPIVHDRDRKTGDEQVIG
jgi:hypothetical protein